MQANSFNIILISNHSERYETVQKIFSQHKLKVAVDINGKLIINTTNNEQHIPLLKEYMERQLTIDLQFRDNKDRQKFLPEIIKYINGITTKLPEFFADIHNKLTPIKREDEWSEITIDMIFKYSKKHLDMLGINASDIKPGPVNPIKECGITSFIRDEQYDITKMLEGAQVSAITYKLLNELSFDTGLDEKPLSSLKDKSCYVVNKNDMDTLKRAFLEAVNGHTVGVVYGINDVHWIACCIFLYKPEVNMNRTMNTKDPVPTINFIIMDTMQGINEGTIQPFFQYEDLRKKVQNLAESFDLELKFRNMSCDGQQFGNCCGLSTAFNVAALLKVVERYKCHTYNFSDYHCNKNFLARLERYIYYFKNIKDKEYYMLGSIVRNIEMSDMIKQLGYMTLLLVADDKELEKLGIARPDCSITDFITSFTKKRREEPKLNILEYFKTFNAEHMPRVVQAEQRVRDEPETVKCDPQRVEDETEVIEEDYEQIPPEDTRYAYSPNSTFEKIIKAQSTNSNKCRVCSVGGL